MLKSEILAQQELYAEAIEMAIKAIEVCKWHDFPYEVDENKRSIAEPQKK